MDEQTFNEEQHHLDETYAKLKDIEQDALGKMAKSMELAPEDIKNMQDEMSFDFASEDVRIETAAEYEGMNALIEAYNRLDEATARRLRTARTLLAAPYFAKVVLSIEGRQKPFEIYLGTAGMTDENYHSFIVDWRSPIAETYYNQSNGKTSYSVDGRTINADLHLRRQFDLDRNVLHAYFDTTVAIEDPLLLKSLSENHSDKLSDITATIQKEQNEVIRHEDVDVLLVNGIAGSGKTSVLLQRIAYLFYRERENLNPEQVFLFTPNPVFGNYINNVLPNMGETNPQISTWDGFVKSLNLTDHGAGASTPAASLIALEEALPHLQFEPKDFQDIVFDGYVLMKAAQVQRSVRKFDNVPAGPRLVGLVTEELGERLTNKLKSMAGDEKIWELLENLDVEEKERLFDTAVLSQDDDDMKRYATQYLEDRFAGVFDELETVPWLRIDRIGSRMLGKPSLTAVEWLYTKMLITGTSAREVRYVMVDEVQDYTEAQLMVMARYFNRAHFLLLGDEHQAIFEQTATFDQIRAVFKRSFARVDECRLLTSYRSTPAITSLFMSMVGGTDEVNATSVQREGAAPKVVSFDDDAAYLAKLRALVSEAAEAPGITAIVAADWGRVKWLEKKLGDTVCVMRSNRTLPEQGAILLDLPLAKGLEFDHVIIPDAQASVYPDTDMSRRRLYTAISRATSRVTILSQGPISPLLADAAD